MNNIITMLEQNNISGHLIKTGDSESISCSHNLKEYIIEKEADTFKLLETNLCKNPRRKNRHHEVDKFQDAREIVEFIKNRKFYMVS